jgi:heptosyltransferase I
MLMKTRNNPLLKKIDYWVGCPLIYFLGVYLKKHKLMNIVSETQKIAILKTAGIGDTVLSDVAIQEIKAQYSNAWITYFCTKSNVAIVKLLDNVDEVVVFDMKHPVRALKELHGLPAYDLILDFAPWPRINAVMSYCLQGKYKVGFKRKKMYRHYIYDCAVEHLDTVHEVENYRNILRAAGIKIHGYNPHLPVEKKKYIDGNYVVFHQYPAGASQLQRIWSITKWIELGKNIYEKYGYKILFSGGTEDKNQAESIAKNLKKQNVLASSIAGKYSLQQMATILAQSKFIVSVNTGIMHMGAAVNVPLIALHGATSDKRWGPLSDKAVTIKSGEPCQPCISLGFESKCKNPVCMNNITVDMVMEKVGYLLR